MTKRLLLLPLLISLLLSTQLIHAGTDSLVLFQPTPCPVQFPAGSLVECGTVTVPQDRAHPEERSVALAVAIFRAGRADAASDPLLYLDGGPGSRTLDAYALGMNSLLSAINRTRDVIIFDYRGMGYSDPALTCPESIGAPDDSWITACRDRYQAQGVDVTDFTTRDNAADAADIIRALGYEQYNIWGGSYGSSVAMTLLRDHPENIRAALVTALQPPQGDLQASIPVDLQDTIAAISELCAADAACSAAFPGDLIDELAIIVERLDDNPLSITVLGEEVEFKGSDLLLGLGELLKDETKIPIVPGLIATLYAGQYDQIETYANALSTPPDPLRPIGAWYSMRCTDSILLTSPEAFNAALEQLNPAFRAAYAAANADQRSECEIWGARVPTEADPQPAITDVPVLIMSGALDPYSSQAWLDSTLATLPNGYGFLVPYHAHYVVGNRCVDRVLTDFINDPTVAPDGTCIEAIGALPFVTE